MARATRCPDLFDSRRAWIRRGGQAHPALGGLEVLTRAGRPCVRRRGSGSGALSVFTFTTVDPDGSLMVAGYTRSMGAARTLSIRGCCAESHLPARWFPGWRTPEGLVRDLRKSHTTDRFSRDSRIKSCVRSRCWRSPDSVKSVGRMTCSVECPGVASRTRSVFSSLIRDGWLLPTRSGTPAHRRVITAPSGLTDGNSRRLNDVAYRAGYSSRAHSIGPFHSLRTRDGLRWKALSNAGLPERIASLHPSRRPRLSPSWK
jgi:hypothetical protein